MKRMDFNTLIDKFSGYRQGIMETKGRNYSGDKDVFYNFKRVGQALGVLPEQVIGIFLSKHIDAIYTYLKGDYVEDTETINTRIADAINYLELLYAYLKEKEPVSTSSSTITRTEATKIIKELFLKKFKRKKMSPFFKAFIKEKKGNVI